MFVCCLAPNQSSAEQKSEREDENPTVYFWARFVKGLNIFRKLSHPFTRHITFISLFILLYLRRFLPYFFWRFHEQMKNTEYLIFVNVWSLESVSLLHRTYCSYLSSTTRGACNRAKICFQQCKICSTVWYLLIHKLYRVNSKSVYFVRDSRL